ncbi:iron-containing alcohol dehydrogenase [Alkalicoccus daliensis]|uniref:Alcohol dehydrogenase, class IV n=1 Tax=Alkalicoccus daliensis TaxID=745820 RepID=A0A1H0EXW9_9BACI|nr:iron-containing alcohol dehydrogenase [Alkalicoccus daliensis]SDN87195.1 Alcohol dehydrogenase, class IV [Alkalicoccus daliensis]
MLDIYQFQTADLIVSGKNSVETLSDKLSVFNPSIKSVLLVTQDGLIDIGLLENVNKQLEKLDASVETVANVLPEPTIESIQEIADDLKGKKFDYIIGVGGGSVLDAAKLLSVLKTNKETLKEMLDTAEVKLPGIPTALIPTTAGTGSEVTPNAIVTIPEQELKVGLVSRHLLPQLVVVDPQLTLGLPKPITAATGMDAYTHAIESFISNKANKLSDMFALESIRLISDSIVEAYDNGKSLEAREKMIVGSMYGGMALTSAGTAAVHALAYPLGGKFNIPHGVANSMLLPHVMSFNLSSIPDERMKLVAQAMKVYEEKDSAEEISFKVIRQIEEWIKLLNIPQDLSEYGVTEDDIEDLAVSASKVTRLLDNNPVALSLDDIKNLYRKLLD